MTSLLWSGPLARCTCRAEAAALISARATDCTPNKSRALDGVPSRLDEDLLSIRRNLGRRADKSERSLGARYRPVVTALAEQDRRRAADRRICLVNPVCGYGVSPSVAVAM